MLMRLGAIGSYENDYVGVIWGVDESSEFTQQSSSNDYPTRLPDEEPPVTGSAGLENGFVLFVEL